MISHCILGFWATSLSLARMVLLGDDFFRRSRASLVARVAF